MNHDTTLAEQKTALREAMKRLRRECAARAELSAQASELLLKEPLWKNARSVLLYVSFKTELVTDALVEALLKDPTKTCWVPYCLPENRLGLFELHSWDELETGSYGIREPRVGLRQDTKPETLDLVVLPGLAFDARGFRLGFGAGYYDRLLENLSPLTRTIGLAFDFQKIDAVPHDSLDRPVDFVATNLGLQRTSPKVIGILGGIACGKSLVSSFLQERGIPIFNADHVGHEALDAPEIQQALAARWGSEIFEAPQKISRSAIASRVFSSEPGAADELAFLNSVVHPWVLDRWQAFRLEHWNEEWLVLDAPLLLEVGWKGLCDERIFVDTPLEMRQKFALQRGWTLEQLALREQSQAPLEEKQAASTRVLKNDGISKENLRTQLNAFFESRSF